MQRDVPEQSISFFTKKLLNFSCLFRINQSIGSLKSSVEPSTSRMVDGGTSSEHKLNIVQNYRQKISASSSSVANCSNLTYAVSLLRFLRSLTHKYTRTPCRTNLNEWSACRRAVIFTTHNKHKKTNIIAHSGFQTRDIHNRTAADEFKNIDCDWYEQVKYI
jgi:hypothetical protein